MTVVFTTHYMEEAERVADKIAIIDQGRIVKEGTAKELRALTKTKSLEEAFLALTGHSLREESSTGMDRMRTTKKIWGR